MIFHEDYITYDWEIAVDKGKGQFFSFLCDFIMHYTNRGEVQLSFLHPNIHVSNFMYLAVQQSILI